MLWRFCTEPLLPLKPGKIVYDVKRKLNTATDHHLKKVLQPLMHVLRKLENELREFSQSIESTSNEVGLEAVNSLFMLLSRILIPAAYTVNGSHDQDLAISQSAVLPRLMELVESIKDLNRETDDYQFTLTGVLRERNRIMDAFHKAREVLRIYRTRLGDHIKTSPTLYRERA